MYCLNVNIFHCSQGFMSLVSGDVATVISQMKTILSDQNYYVEILDIKFFIQTNGLGGGYQGFGCGYSPPPVQYSYTPQCNLHKV